MKRIVLVFLALLLTVGVASATNYPKAVDPKNNREIWVTSVFNSEESTTMDVGDCAEWEMDSSTGDDKNYVVQCDAADTHYVAGIVWPADIAAQTSGTMVIKGPVQADTNVSALGAGSLVCSSSTAGAVQTCSALSDANAIGFVTAAGTGTLSAIVNVFAR